ncbi:hypothetical protein LBA_01155 [Megavirus lba]|uniref:Uncharacterized protein n=1 Tax=Megavirus lba TaxID=1235314 RepID=L7Y7S8_9VIRU|nr:hypothetical protein LBA_01155 [Megavirus lba]
MQFDFKNGGVYKLDKDLRGYKKVYCSYVGIWNRDFKKAIMTLRIPKGQTVVIPDIKNKHSTLDDTDVDGIMKTDEVYVEKIEDLDNNTIGDHFECTSSKSNGPQYPLKYDSNGVVIGHDYITEYNRYEYVYALGKKYQARLDLNHNNITGSGYFLYSTKEQAKKSAEYY